MVSDPSLFPTATTSLWSSRFQRCWEGKNPVFYRSPISPLFYPRFLNLPYISVVRDSLAMSEPSVDVPDFSGEEFAPAREKLTSHGVPEDTVLEVLRENWVMFARAHPLPTRRGSSTADDDDDGDSPHPSPEPPEHRPSPPPPTRNNPKQPHPPGRHPATDSRQALTDNPILINFNIAPPSRTQDRPARVAIELLKKRKFCPLDYFTEHGMKLARRIDPNAPDSVTLAPLAGIRRDSELTLDEIHSAVPRFLRYISEFGWGDGTVRAHSDFFAYIDTFPSSRSSDVQPGLAAVVHNWREEWHASVDNAVVWNIAAIPEAEVQRTIDDTRRSHEAEEHRAALAQREREHREIMVSNQSCIVLVRRSPLHVSTVYHHHPIHHFILPLSLSRPHAPIIR